MSSLQVEPPFWWCGLKNTNLQILIYSNDDLNHTLPKIQSQDVVLLDTVIFPNPHYIAMYFDLSNAKPQTFDIELNGNIIHYELKQRKPNSDKIQGFDSSDVIYLLMPDRFARHSDEPSEIDNQIGITNDQALEEIHKREKEIEEKKKEESKEKEKNNKKEKEEEKEEEEDQKEKQPPTRDVQDDGLFHNQKEIPNYKTFTDPITNTERVLYKVNRQDPNARHGGNIRGIIDHLDYLNDLGVTALWLNPICDNDMPDGSYHGYACTNFYNIDPRFGTISDLLELVERLHEQGNKLIMDIIFNHCGSNHIWYKDPPCKDWINNIDKGIQCNHDIPTSFSPYTSKIDWEEFNCGSFVSTMPDLNQRNRHLATYLIQNTIWWIEFAQINGIRIDTYPYCDPDFTRNLVDEIMNEYPSFNIVGETWIENPLGVSFWQKGNPYSKNNLPTIMDFTIGAVARKVAFEETNAMSGLSQLKLVLNYDFAYPDIFHTVRFLDNHDTVRFLIDKRDDIEPIKAPYTILLTIPGIPQIYYGSEILMCGDKKFTDGFIRLDFPGGWKNDKQNCFTADGRTKQQNDFFNFIKTLLNWRKGNEVISKGSMIHFRPQNGIYVYQRSYNNKSAIILLNGTDSKQEVLSKRYKEILTEVHLGTDIFTKREFDFSTNFTLEAREVVVLDMHK